MNANDVTQWWRGRMPNSTFRELVVDLIHRHDAVTKQRDDLLAALEQMRKALGALGDDIDDEADLGRDDKPNQALRLSMKHSARVGAAYRAADAAIAKARGTP